MHDVVDVLQVVLNMDAREVIVPITMQWDALSIPSLEKEVQQRWTWHILPVDKATTKDVSIEGRVGQVEQSFLQLVVSGPEGIWDSPVVVMGSEGKDLAFMKVGDLFHDAILVKGVEGRQGGSGVGPVHPRGQAQHTGFQLLIAPGFHHLQNILTLLTDMDQVHHYHIAFHDHPTQQQRILTKLQ